MAGCGFLWSILWLLILLLLGWPIGFFCAVWYLILSPFTACCSEACEPLVQLLERGLRLPLTCANNMKNMTPLC